jgi:hypothetical protein
MTSGWTTVRLLKEKETPDKQSVGRTSEGHYLKKIGKAQTLIQVDHLLEDREGWRRLCCKIHLVDM